MVALPLDSPIWAQLPAAYGTAEGISDAWRKCLREDAGEQWYDLLNEVCHQGTPYGVVWALIPHIVEHLSTVSLTGWTVGLEIVATNIRRAPEDPPFEELRRPYDRALGRLRQSIINMLRERGIALANADAKDEEDLRAEEFDPSVSVARLVFECVCACLGKFAAADAISSMECDEWFLYVLCPDCNELLRVALSPTGPELASVDGTAWPSGRPSPTKLLDDVGAALVRGRSALEQPPQGWTDQQTLLALASFAADTLANQSLAAMLVGATVCAPCPGCGARLEMLEHLCDEG